MGSKRFNKPPLVELIAELRWLPAGIGMSADSKNLSVPPQFFTESQSDSVFMLFGSKVVPKGYTQIERLAPAGMPSIPFQPVIRFSRPNRLEDGSPLFHLGPGLFSVHATPPYKSWDEFRPYLIIGLEALLTSRAEPERAGEIILTTVRYIDAFTDDFRDGLSSAKFLTDVLGFNVSLPLALKKRVTPDAEVTPHFRFTLPLGEGLQMNFSIAEGQVGTQAALVMDTSVTCATPVTPDVDSVMRVLDLEHDVVSESFIELTSKLHSRMDPQS